MSITDLAGSFETSSGSNTIAGRIAGPPGPPGPPGSASAAADSAAIFVCNLIFKKQDVILVILLLLDNWCCL